MIAFDAATDGDNNGGANNSHAFGHTCAGANRLLLVCALGDNGPAASDYILTPTYDSVAMSVLASQGPLGSSSRWLKLFGLLAPSVGLHTVVIPASATDYIFGLAASYTGVRQSGLPDAVTTDTFGGASATRTSTLTTIADNCWTVMVESGYNGGPAPSAGAGTTLRAVLASFGAGGLFDSNGPITPAGSTSLIVTRTSPIEGVTAMVSIAPFLGAGAGAFDPHLTGF